MGCEYISEQQDITFVSSYLDDGISGQYFDRPEFQECWQISNWEKINMVIIKDVSRFGTSIQTQIITLESIFQKKVYMCMMMGEWRWNGRH